MVDVGWGEGLWSGGVNESRASTKLSERFLAPDLARGVMLLFIAVANSHYFLQNGPTLGGFPVGTSGVDAFLVGLIATLVDGRAYPMFAALFGYGLVQIYRRQQAAGKDWEPIRKLLRRRSLWMIVIGFLHGIFLYVGDILAAYGILAFLLVPALRWKTRTIVILATLAFVITSLPDAGSLAVERTVGQEPAMLPQGIWSGVMDRAPALLVLVPLYPIGLVVPFLIGILAARARLLEQPGQHLTLLRRVAGFGIGAAILGGLPIGLILAGAVDEPTANTLGPLGTLHDATGHFGGLGYAAAIALLSNRINVERGRVVTALAAVGQRSMTCYLAQSLVWTLAFAPYAFNLTPHLTVTTLAAIAVATWLATVVFANWMHHRGLRGPFEVLLRRLTYRDKTAGDAASGTTSTGAPEPLAGTDQISESPSDPVRP